MIEAIVTYLVVSKIINCFFIAVMVNAGAFELLFGAAVVLGMVQFMAVVWVKLFTYRWFHGHGARCPRGWHLVIAYIL